MKKFLTVFLSFLLILSLTACSIDIEQLYSYLDEMSQGANTNSISLGENETEIMEEISSASSKKSNNTSKKQPTQNDTSKYQSTQDSTSQSYTEASSEDIVTSNKPKLPQSSSSKKTTETSSKGSITKNSTSSKKTDNGALENASTKNMNVPENMKLLAADEASEENNAATITASVVAYELDGSIVNWTTEKDLLYVITKGNNRLVVINSKTMEVVSNVPLAGVPAELNFVDDKIYISLPDLCRIDIFSKSNPAKLSSLYFDHEVSSFCVDGDYIYYSEHDQHCDVYKKNMNTNALTKILPDRGWSFSEPKLYLNKEDNILYIGETSCSGCAIFYYDATTLQLKSLFRKNDYGIWNHTRDIFHIGDEIFWGNYRLSDTNAKQVVGRYGKGDYGSVNFASSEVVSTFEGLFLTDTYECIINYFDANFRFEYILVTDSYNVFFRERKFDNKVIIGVNFSMQ